MKLSTYLLTALAVATTTSAWRVKFTGFMESTKDDHTQELQCHGKDKSKHLDKCFKLIPKYSQKTSHIEFLNDNDKLRLIAYDDDRCGGTVVADVKPSDFDLKRCGSKEPQRIGSYMITKKKQKRKTLEQQRKEAVEEAKKCKN
jgi:hypothetical protein